MNIPILMYHEIIDTNAAGPTGPQAHTMAQSYYVHRDMFERQLAFLSSHDFTTVSLADVISLQCAAPRESLPERSIVLSFDDGYEGVYRHAFPLLKKYGFQAVIFVTVNKVGKPGMLTWPMLKEMSAAGMSIQSHTKTHQFLKRLSDARIIAELRDSKRIIEHHLHLPVRYISLPHGSYGRTYAAIARACGYRGGCTSRIGYNTPSTNEFLLKRIHISNRFTLEKFRKIVMHESLFVAFLSLKQALRALVRSFLGEERYMGVYRIIFGIR